MIQHDDYRKLSKAATTGRRMKSWRGECRGSCRPLQSECLDRTKALFFVIPCIC